MKYRLIALLLNEYVDKEMCLGFNAWWYSRIFYGWKIFFLQVCIGFIQWWVF